MRAGPLSHTQTIAVLNRQFVNTWILNKTLKSLKDSADSAETRDLAAAVFKNRIPRSPVDSFVFTPRLELVGSRDANGFLGNRDCNSIYLKFLTDALAKATP